MEREILIDKSKARLCELEDAQRRTHLELEEWSLQEQLVNETMHAARILEIAAEREARLAQSDWTPFKRRSIICLSFVVSP
jgi:hypothetical protein